MKKKLRQVSLCATISLLFVLAVFAQRQAGLLGPETVRIAVVTAAALPPAPVTLADGPSPAPDPVDIPMLARMDGPSPAPDPVDIPARLTDGPSPAPDPVDIPGLKDGPSPAPDPVDIPALGRRA